MIHCQRFLWSLFHAGCFLLLFLQGIEAGGQLSHSVTLPSHRYNLSLSGSEIRLGGLDRDAIASADEQSSSEGAPFRIGLMVPVDVDPNSAGRWVTIPGEGRLWYVTLVAEGALALSPYFDSFRIPQGGELFVYNSPNAKISGAHTHVSNPQGMHYATEYIEGSSITLEYFEPSAVSEPLLMHISDIAYIYRGLSNTDDSGQRGFGDSGSCEVNIKCKEGNSWQDEKKGVVRILLRNGSFLFWCNGSVVNNTRQDFEPYVLTADHCAYYAGNYSSASDLAQWIFYFKYESETCADPSTEPTPSTIVGASLISQGGDTGETGSDFYLVLLNSKIPSSYDPFFLGWNRQDSPPQYGVTIHHPQGDIRKISTYTQPAVTSSWDGNGLQSHWRVSWTETVSGFGVVEPGSSGSPLFNEEGLIAGTLSGGLSSCSNTDGYDYFGKFSYHWQTNGTEPNERLSPWLDPDNTGVTRLQGTYYSNITVAAFKADTTVMPVKGKMDFIDLSSGMPTQWEWYFEGGDPSVSDLQNPEGVRFESIGSYDVSLIVRNEISSDTLLLKDYITVGPVISPNPAVGPFTLFFGKTEVAPEQVHIFNYMGMRVPFRIVNSGDSFMTIDMQGHPAGTYLVRVVAEGFPNTSKVTLIR